MGGGHWNNDFYEDRAVQRAATNTPVFKHDADVRAGRVSALHEALDPSKLKNGVREARDSAEHPHSRVILFGLDQTGSMGDVPPVIQSALGKLMTTLLTKGLISHPQILFGAIGDALTGRVGDPYRPAEKAPLQVGQFESGNEIEDDLTRIYLEKNGGGQGRESYDLFLYFAVHHTATDSWEKRQEKGYLFMTGDEMTYPSLSAETIHRVFGGEMPPRDYTIEELVAAAQERYHVYFIVPNSANANSSVHQHWVGLLDSAHVLHLDHPEQICDVVALTIGLNEGTATPESLVEVLEPSVKTALDPVLAASRKTIEAVKKDGAKTARL